MNFKETPKENVNCKWMWMEKKREIEKGEKMTKKKKRW